MSYRWLAHRLGLCATVVFTLLWQGCLTPGDERVVPNASGAFNIIIEDVGNAGNASDIRVLFSMPLASSQLRDLRLFVLPELEVLDFNLFKANSIGQAGYTLIPEAGEQVALRLSSSTTDINGNQINEQTSYRVMVLTPADGPTFQNDHLSLPSAAFRLGDTAPVMRTITAADVGNEGNASDLQITLTPPADQTGVDHYRLMLIPEAQVSNFTVSQALQVSTARYEHILPDAAFTERRYLPADFPDVRGNPITNDQAYRLAVLTVASEGSGLETTLSRALRTTIPAHASYIKTITLPFMGTGQMTTGADGMIYISEAGPDLNQPQGNRIWQLDPDTEQLSVFADDIFAPLAMTAAGGFLYVAGYYSGELWAYNLLLPGSAPELLGEWRWDPSYLRFINGGLVCHDRRSRQLMSVQRIALGGYFLEPLFNGLGEINDLEEYGYFAVSPDNQIIFAFPDRPYLFAVPNFDITVPTWHIVSDLGMGGFNFESQTLFGCARNSHEVFSLKTGFTPFIQDYVAGGGLPGKADGELSRARLAYPKELIVQENGRTYYVQDLADPTVGPAQFGPVVIRKIVVVD